MSDSTAEVSTVPVPERPPLRPLWRRAVALITAPRSVFEELEARPAWFWTAIVLCVVAVAVSYLIWNPVIYPYILDRMQSRDLTPEQMTKAESLYAAPAMQVFSSLSAGGANLAFVVVLGLLLFAVCTFLLGGKATVRQSLAVAAHASLVHIPRALLVLPVMLARKDPSVSLGPGVLLPVSEAEGFAARSLANFLAGLDLFNLWQLALCILGMSVVARLPAKQTATGLIVGYLVVIAVWSLGAAAFPR